MVSAICMGRPSYGPLAMALLDRLVEGAIILKVKGKTYRTPLVKSEDNPA
jgi:hypothetical protein